MSIGTWIDGTEATLDVVWTAIDITISVSTDKTLSSILIKAQNDNSAGSGVCYFDDFSLEPGVSVDEGDITYVTRLDHRSSLPASIPHAELTEPYLHPPGAHTHPGSPLILLPEYPGAIIRDKESDNEIDIELEYEALIKDKHYYKFSGSPWAGGKQGIELCIRIGIPDGFTGWEENAIEIRFETSNESLENNQLDAHVGKAVLWEPYYYADKIENASSGWSTITFSDTDLDGMCEAGDEIELRFDIYCDKDNYVKLGKISINWQ